MNFRICSPLIGFLALLLPSLSLAQEWSVGPKAYLGLSRALTVGTETVLPIGTISTVADGDATLSGLGVFARYDRPRWYAEVDFMQGKSYSANLNLTSPMVGSGPTYSSARRYDARLIVGYKPLPWLRVSAGLVGVANKWRQYDNSGDIARLDALAQAQPNQSLRERFQAEANQYRLYEAAGNSLKKNLLEAQFGIGADMGGLTLDLTYNPGLTPVVDGITYGQRTYALQQRYAFWSLGVGYKLFPLKKHLLAPRKNKAYARLQRDIPFIRNEFSVGIGMLAEDLDSEFIYENRYTRYLSPRFGLTAGLAFQRGLAGFQAYDPVNARSSYRGLVARNVVSLLLGGRTLLLYSRHHRIGLGAGIQLSYADATVQGTGGRSVDINGQPVFINYLNIRNDSRETGISLAPQASFDYQFLPTDRIAIGPWIRATPDFGSFGIQAGYRF